ncbi:hypothetical protein, unlikely [Trypanosoma brucei gambiense DAL972]|uniref:Uncharacterized protein n=1 Tax=Trypanosoma brucei gambiense (strain MHOM/CI/86/DAL972) TaxID=679716 RepID=D0A4Q5_TRYB9|nr:hypothetical protein, unlikely [Trypanosoma brucei gambiense DAL972]CBH16249.1 hypothetical protein, unlikely [Trypanosoma brucei gambiense DAL972]|eukprot:XP_011778513.1 hypothetical protein, unlikely [Trypanosoma brucei gambiense DAL972]
MPLVKAHPLHPSTSHTAVTELSERETDRCRTQLNNPPRGISLVDTAVRRSGEKPSTKTKQTIRGSNSHTGNSKMISARISYYFLFSFPSFYPACPIPLHLLPFLLYFIFFFIFPFDCFPRPFSSASAYLDMQLLERRSKKKTEKD